MPCGASRNLSCSPSAPQRTGDSAPAYEADTYTFLIGADRSFAERFLAGFTLGYETTDADTLYNGGDQDRDAGACGDVRDD